jgi:ABC-type transport system involved in cytochrome c biogenesis permease subunit
MNDPQHMNGILAAIVGFYLVFFIIAMVAIIVPFWFILKKAGFSPWLSLINMVPFGTLILLYVVAFAEWKVIPAPQLAFQPSPYPPQPPFPPQL